MWDETLTIPCTLPEQTTTFIGRADELAEISDLLLDPACRLLSLVGFGGTGKTRLAIQIASQMLGNFPDGVFFISLASANSEKNLIDAIASEVTFRPYDDLATGEPGAGSLEKWQLIDYLSGKTLLLLMDNFEHLLGHASFISDILAESPGLKVLATSRQPLNLQEEWVRHIEGMRYPASPEVEDLDEYSAVNLFFERATRVRGDFSLSEERDCVVRICQLVQGMPLAIELAAAWLKSLPCETLAREIQRNADILATTLRNIPERHRSIRAVFDESWKMISKVEQEVYVKLSVFQGGFDCDAAADVCGANLGILSLLTDKSLLRINAAGRYEIHDLLRQYACEKLRLQDGAEDALRQSHMTYYLGFLKTLEADLKGNNQKEALIAIKNDFNNIRTAWGRGIQKRDFTAIDKAVGALELYFHLSGDYSIGDEMFQSAARELAPRPDEQEHPVWGRVLSRNIFHKIEPEVDLPYLEKSLAIARRDNNRSEIAFSQMRLGDNYFCKDLEKCISLHKECIEIFKQLKDQYYLAQLYHMLGAHYSLSGRSDQAMKMTRLSLELRQEIGDKIGSSYSLNNLGALADKMGRYAEAEDYYSQANAIQREYGDKGGIAFTDVNIGLMAIFNGNTEKAVNLAEEALKIGREIKFDTAQGFAMILLALVANTKEECTRALEMLLEGKRLITNIDVTFAANFGLSMTYCFLHEYHQAYEFHRLASEFALKLESPSYMTLCLPSAAMILASENKKRASAELLGLLLSHPASPQGWLGRCCSLQKFQKQLEQDLTSPVFIAAKKRGEGFDLYSEFKKMMSSLYNKTAAGPTDIKKPEDEQVQRANLALPEPLTERELEVLSLVAAGMSNRAIARKLVVALGTVKSHVHNIITKLGVASRAEAISKSRQIGLLR